MDINGILGKDIGRHLGLESAKLYKGRRSLQLIFSSDRLLTSSQVSRVKSKLSEAVRSCTDENLNLDLTVRFPLARRQLSDDPEAAKVIMETWCDLLPMLSPIIRRSKLIESDGTLTLYVPAAAAEIITGTENEKVIRAVLRDSFGIEDELFICSDSAIPMPSSKRPKLGGVQAQRKNKAPVKTGEKEVIFGRAIKSRPISMYDVKEDSGRITVKGSIFSMEEKSRKNGGCILLLSVTDKTNTLPVKLFLGDEDEKIVADKLKECKKRGDELIIRGDYRQDGFTGEMVLMPYDINCTQAERRQDNYPQKRVELHIHTRFSAMDALLKAEGRDNDAVNTAKRFGHQAVAITDHGVVHGFPSAVSAAKSAGIKAILGVEGYLIKDGFCINFDSEFAAVSINTDCDAGASGKISVSSVRFTADRVIDRFYISTNYEEPSKFDIDAINSGAAMESNPELERIFTDLMAFLGDSTLVVESRDELIRMCGLARRFNASLKDRFIDVEMLTRYLHRELNDYGLEAASGLFGVDAEKTRAETIIQVFAGLMDEMRRLGLDGIPMCAGFEAGHEKGHGHHASHIILLAKDREGLKNLYKLVSYSHMEHFKGVPRIPRSLLCIHRKGLIIGSACEAGELFRALLNGSDQEEVERIARFYDYLEIQPVGNNDFLRREGRVKTVEDLRDFNRRIVGLGAKLNIPVVATGDVHFLNPEDALFRAILMNSKGFEDAFEQAPLYFKTTDEMMEEFAYLGSEKAFEVVIKNTNMIADMCESMMPFPDDKRTYAPAFEGAEEELKNMALGTAHSIYGDPLPEVVQKRLDRELSSIISNGYASLYLMAQRLVKKSLDDGYLVGSRGSVGSSFVATVAGITEVNPLPPHYVCPECKHAIFDVDAASSRCGVDMAELQCPNCATLMNKLGYDIPFEVFLGFKGDKTPDIDLNFSGDYQSIAHAYTEEMFGVGHAFKAGTISAVQQKTAFGYVKKYCEDREVSISKAEAERLASGCAGVKRTTGQHPGGIVIVPEDMEIFDFTPVQFPADKSEKNITITHFDFHAMDDKLVKLDILGHDDPTALRMLHDITGLDPRTIPLDDPETMRIFSSSEPLGISLDDIDCEVGSIGIPEFGTAFVRQMLMDTRPTTMEELVRISGLSHGESVWVGNARDLVLDGTATLSEVICTRDDIMNYLLSHGGEPSMAFKIMESVRKGKGLTADMEAWMNGIKIPKWFIDSCKKIKYMFPRAHAAAYVMMSFRVAYYKVHYPEAYYTVYYTVRADAFDIIEASVPINALLRRIRAISDAGDKASEKDKGLLTILEVVYEMRLRGIELLGLDLYKSDATRFKLEEEGIRPPFSSLAGVGEVAAIMIAKAASESRFTSIKDFKDRAKVSNTVLDMFKSIGLLEGLSDTDQLSMF